MAELPSDNKAFEPSGTTGPAEAGSHACELCEIFGVQPHIEPAASASAHRADAGSHETPAEATFPKMNKAARLAWNHGYECGKRDGLAASPASALPEWQPGATAPTDGSAFRAYHPALIHADFNPSGSVEACFDGERFIGAVWNGTHDIWNTLPIEPVLWQPLPPAPASALVAPRKDKNADMSLGGAAGADSKA